MHRGICHADTNLLWLTQIYAHAAVLSHGSLFQSGGDMPKRREAKLDLCGDNNIGDLKCLVGMIWLNHLITYITTAACSAVCQWCARTCVCFQSSPLCISICACLCSGKQALKSYDWLRRVCLNTWWLKRIMSTKGPTWDSFFFVRRMAKVHSHAVHTNSFISICDYE